MLYEEDNPQKRRVMLCQLNVYPYPVPNYCDSTIVLLSALSEFCKIFNHRTVCNISSRN